MVIMSEKYVSTPGKLRLISTFIFPELSQVQLINGSADKVNLSIKSLGETAISNRSSSDNKSRE